MECRGERTLYGAPGLDGDIGMKGFVWVVGSRAWCISISASVSESEGSSMENVVLAYPDVDLRVT
jgi:hypothetical protein